MRVQEASTWLRPLALLTLFFASTTSAVAAQTSRQSAGNLDSILSPGMTVWITDATGREEKTRVIDVSGDVLTVARDNDVRRLRTSEVMRVRARRSDSVLNGALIGAGAGVASGLFLCRLTEPWEVCRNNKGPLSLIAALGAVAGIGVDAMIRGRRTIYEVQRTTRLHVSPLVGSRSGGLQLSLTF